MDDKNIKTAEECRTLEPDVSKYYSAIPELVKELAGTCNTDDCFDHVSSEPIPSNESVIDIIHRARSILFPGFFTQHRLDPVNLEFWMGQETVSFFDAVSRQVSLSIRHDCRRYNQLCSLCEERGFQIAHALVEALPEIKSRLAGDVRAAMEGDPAAGSFDEIIFSYPGIFAITIHRIAHVLHSLEVPIIPRIMSEYAHSQTGIDIHPGAEIGDRFFIDHGTGVVIGGTAVIGNDVRLYQGVTLGALSLPEGAGKLLRGKKRHPTIEDRVIIYANATILGGDTVIGEESIIGGNVWITESVPPNTKVVLKSPELVIVGKRGE